MVWQPMQPNSENAFSPLAWLADMEAGVGVSVRRAAGEGVGPTVGVGVGLTVGVVVGVGTGVGVGEGVSPTAGVGVGKGVCLIVGMGVAVGVGPGVAGAQPADARSNATSHAPTSNRPPSRLGADFTGTLVPPWA